MYLRIYCGAIFRYNSRDFQNINPCINQSFQFYHTSLRLDIILLCDDQTLINVCVLFSFEIHLSHQQVLVFVTLQPFQFNMSSQPVEHMDLGDLPVVAKDKICKILDHRDKWEKLGELMQFELLDIDVS